LQFGAGDGGALMWRLLDGELPTTWTQRVVVIMVGNAESEGTNCSVVQGMG
jgi:hypothetical protein